MIDEKKIEEAAEKYADDATEINTGLDWYNHANYGFREGAHWAINKFLKDLWHPISEEPRKDVSIIVETHNDKNMFYYAWNRWQDNFYPSWTDAVICSRVSRWLYIDDLFPKKGGEQ